MKDFCSLYLLLRRGGNTVAFSLRHAWTVLRNAR